MKLDSNKSEQEMQEIIFHNREVEEEKKQTKGMWDDVEFDQN